MRTPAAEAHGGGVAVAADDGHAAASGRVPADHGTMPRSAASKSNSSMPNCSQLRDSVSTWRSGQHSIRQAAVASGAGSAANDPSCPWCAPAAVAPVRARAVPEGLRRVTSWIRCRSSTEPRARRRFRGRRRGVPKFVEQVAGLGILRRSSQSNRTRARRSFVPVVLPSSQRKPAQASGAASRSRLRG